jgi:DHA3 family macrolide efflux protein-like MFS transporter
MARFRHVVGNRNFLCLWFAQIISQFGDRLDQMALIGLVYRFAPGSTTQIAKLMAFTILPVFLIGPVAGVYVDRWDRRRTMVICDLARAGLVALIPFVFMRGNDLWPIYAVVFLVFSVGRFYVPAKMSIIPEIVKDEHLLLANSLVNTTGMVAAMLGLGLGGILVEAIGARGGFVVDAFSFLLSGTLTFFICARAIARLKTEKLLKVGKDIMEVVRKSPLHEMKDALIFLKNQHQLKSVFGVLFFLWGVLGVVYVVSIVFVQRIFGSVTREIGLIVVGLGAGLFLGSILFGRMVRGSVGSKALFACILAGGVVLFAFVTIVSRLPNLLVALGLAFLLGFVIAPVMAISQTLVQQLTASSMRGKLFSSLEIVVHLAFLSTMLISAPLADKVGPGAILIGVSLALCGVGAWGVLSKYDPIRRT